MARELEPARANEVSLLSHNQRSPTFGAEHADSIDTTNHEIVAMRRKNVDHSPEHAIEESTGTRNAARHANVGRFIFGSLDEFNRYDLDWVLGREFDAIAGA